MLNNELLFSVLMYLDILSFNNIKNINRFTLRLYNNNKYYTQLKSIYNLDVNIRDILKKIIISLNKCCFICNKSKQDKKVLILYNILPKTGKCLLCYNYGCDCSIYLYGHEECLKNFEKIKYNNSKIRYFKIKDLSDYTINGLSI
tara:strand:+ start:362 stop:796 length:435 start_codon:yes stop_codon:yes gene_type:complete